MSRITTLPQYKAIVMLHCQNNHLHAGSLHGFTPLVGIQVLQVEDFGVFHTCSPFTAGKCIGTEMDKRNVFIMKSSQLVFCWNHMSCLFDNHFFTVIGLDWNRVLKRHLLLLICTTSRQ